MSPEIHAIISAGRATYLDLQEKLSVRDMYNILESLAVENYNSILWQRQQEAMR